MLVKIVNARAGRYVYTAEAYRDEHGRTRQRLVEKHGRLEDLLAADPDALARLRERARALTADREGSRGAMVFDTAAPSDTDAALNLGWGLADAVLERLGVARLLRDAGKAGGWRVDAAAVARLLVAQRLVDPCSKPASWEHRARLAGGPAMDLGHVYQGLDRIAGLAEAIQRAVSAALGRTAGSLASVDYDVTNYFFHIDFPDEAPEGKTAPRGRATRQRGHSKESRPDPIIQMGLFLDGQGLPVAYRLFDQNVPDVSTLPAAIGDFKALFADPRVVVVTDKAMNTADNLGWLFQHEDGWIVSASARHADAGLRVWILDEAGWADAPGGARVKSAVMPREVRVTEWGVSGLRKLLTEKVVVRWSPEAAARDAHTRADMLDRARAFVAGPARYKASNKRGVKAYVTSATIDPGTGEVLDAEQVLALDEARAEQDALMDGYQLIRTSETHLADQAVLDRYHQLWRIENTFRLSKTDLRARPVYVPTRAHIEAHFAICFLALLVARLLHQQTGLDAPALLGALRGLQAVPVGQGVHKIIRPPAWDAIDEATGVSTDQAWATLSELRSWRRGWTTAAKHARFITPTQPPE